MTQWLFLLWRTHCKKCLLNVSDHVSSKYILVISDMLIHPFRLCPVSSHNYFPFLFACSFNLISTNLSAINYLLQWTWIVITDPPDRFCIHSGLLEYKRRRKRASSKQDTESNRDNRAPCFPLEEITFRYPYQKEILHFV